MSIPSFKKELLSNQKKYFSQYRFTYIEKRTIIIEMRINISQDSFIIKTEEYSLYNRR